MTDPDAFRPLVAVEVRGLLGLPLHANLETRFIPGTGAEIAFRREQYPARFLSEPRWDENGEYVERWAFLGRGMNWLRGLLYDGVDVVWATRYERFANTYFSPALQLPDLPTATRDDGRFHTSEAEWKASQLGQSAYADRPVLWVNDELTTAGRHLLERYRKPAMRALTLSRYIPDSMTDGDAQFMNEWLELVRTPAGQRELRTMRQRLQAKRRRRDFSSERLHSEWVRVRARLNGVVDFRSGISGPLAAYAVDHLGELDLRVVERIREEWGLSTDPSAAELLPLLEIGQDGD